MNLRLEKEIDNIKLLSIDELSEKFNCKPEQICTGDYYANLTDDKVCPYKVILGFANFENSDVEDLGDLEYVYGKKIQRTTDCSNAIYVGLNLSNSKIKDMGKLRKIYGVLTLNNDIKDLGNVEFLGSGLYTNKTKIKSLGNKMRTIDGRLNVEGGELESFGTLKKVNGDIFIDSSYVQNFGNIESFNNIDIKFAYRDDPTKCEILQRLKNLINNGELYNTEMKNVNRDRYGANSTRRLINFIKEDIISDFLNTDFTVKFLEEKIKSLKNKDNAYIDYQQSIILKDYKKCNVNNDASLTFEGYYAKLLKENISRELDRRLKSLRVDIAGVNNKSIEYIIKLVEETRSVSLIELNNLGFKISNSNYDNVTYSQELKERLQEELNSKLNQIKNTIKKIDENDSYYLSYLKMKEYVDKKFKFEDGKFNKIDKGIKTDNSNNISLS